MNSTIRWSDIESSGDEITHSDVNGEDSIRDTRDRTNIMLVVGSIRSMQFAYEAAERVDLKHRSISTDHSTLSRYINEHSCELMIETGYLGTFKYISTLHVPAMVPGHIHKLICINQSQTTRLGTTLLVSSIVSVALSDIGGVRPSVLSRYIRNINELILVNDINQSVFAHTVSQYNGDYEAGCPIVLGYLQFVETLNEIDLHGFVDDKIYIKLFTSFYCI